MTNYQAYLLCAFIWGVIIWGGTGYAVFVLGQSGWWFVLTALISGVPSYKEYTEDK